MLRYLLIAITLVCFTLATPALAQAQVTQEWSQGDDKCQTNDGVATIQGIQCLVGNVLSVAVTIIGLAAFAMIIYGGFKLMLSGGGSKSIEDARNTLTFAIAGIILALSAFIILNLIAAFTGVGDILILRIPT